jgi:hypothetical protein
MVTVLLAATGLMFCQETMTFESGVVRVQPGPEWIVGQPDFCTTRTVLSPDGARPLDLPPPPALNVPNGTTRSEGGVTETTLIPPKPIARAPVMQCKPTYRLQTVELHFAKDAVELSQEHKGQLAGLLVDKPSGLSVLRYVDEREDDRNSAEVARARVAAIRKYVEQIMVTVPSFTQETRTVADKKVMSRSGIPVTAIYQYSCGGESDGERVTMPPVARPANPVPAAVMRDNKGGEGVAQ